MRREADPVPRGGAVEQTYCKLRAKDGVWSPVFLGILRRAYGSEAVPQRFHDIAMRMKIEIEKERRIESAIEMCECGCRGNGPPLVRVSEV